MKIFSATENMHKIKQFVDFNLDTQLKYYTLNN